jgi:hypothetical protein
MTKLNYVEGIGDVYAKKLGGQAQALSDIF